MPITCVGFQAHLVINESSFSTMQQNMQRFANLGLKLRITEIDIRIPLPADSSELTSQANNYRTVVNIAGPSRPAVHHNLGHRRRQLVATQQLLRRRQRGGRAALEQPVPAEARLHPVHNALAAGGPTSGTVPGTRVNRRHPTSPTRR